MVTVLMSSAKIATLVLDKIKVFWNRDHDVIFSVYNVTSKILSSDSNYIANVVMPIIDNIMLFVLFTMLLRFSIQIVNTFSGSWRSWASMTLSIWFANYLLKASTKSVWACLCFLFCFSSVNIVLFKQFCHITFKVRSMI